MTDLAAGGAPATAPPPTTRAYRTYVMLVLVAIYATNFIDRNLMGVLGQAIKSDLILQDWQLGVLGGPAFALLYSLGGVPVARVAERHNRVTIIAVAVTVWSTMTALCGVALGFWTLALARVGVGIGEAAYTPPSYSLIADYYPPNRRASAFGLFTLGVPIGAFCAAILGGLLAQGHGWRFAFIALGLPGLIGAVLLRATVREPARGGFDAAVTDETPPTFAEVLKHLSKKKSFIHLTIGAALTSMSGYAVVQFAIPFLLRGYGIDLKTAATLYGVFGAISAAIGIGLGGFLADAAGKRDPRLRALIPGIALMLSGPGYIIAFLQPTLFGLGATIILPAILQYLYFGPVFGMGQNMVSARMRATTSALFGSIMTVMGLAFGPPLVGLLSDVLAAKAYTGLMPFAPACPGGVAPHGAAGFAAESCRAASFHGLQQALVIAVAVYVWSGFHYVLASRTLREDLEVS
jgi:predicted MFS family arabinose efflux permease